jgi:hypothetical protein
MSDTSELADGSFEHAHGHHAAVDPNEATWTKRAAVMVAMFAAVAVIVEMSANDAQTEYLARYVAASDAWNQYQAKSVRKVAYSGFADVLEAQAGPAPSDPVRQHIAAARANAARMQSDVGKDGMDQLSVRAHEEEAQRDHEKALHDRLERSVRGLQIAIVMLGLFIVTRLRWVLALGASLGAVAALYAIIIGGSALVG